MDWTVFANFALFGVDGASRHLKAAQASMAANDTDSRSAYVFSRSNSPCSLYGNTHFARFETHSIQYWLELTKDVDINEAQRKLIEEQLFTLRQNFLMLKAEQESLSEDLLDMIR